MRRFDIRGKVPFETLKTLINRNSDDIRHSFHDWLKLPADVAQDPVAIQSYVDTLGLIARLFERSGDSSLIQQMQGGNPLHDWQQRVEAAQASLDQGRAHEAVALLKGVLDELDADGTIVRSNFRPMVLGRLGAALVKAGDKREAFAVTRQALELCQTLGDEQGVQVYTANLQTIGTFETPAHDGTDRNVTVAVKNEQGDTLKLDELKAVSGSIKWEVGDPSLPAEAKRLREEGRAAGARGDYDAALSLLTQAVELAPGSPYPVYDRAFAHLLRQEFELALEDYRRTVELAPGGFYTAETAVDTLTREAQGELPSGFYASFAMMEHMPPEQQKLIAAQLVEKLPSYAPGWMEFASHLADPAERLAAIERGLAARPDRHTHGLLLLNQAITISDAGDTARGLAMLRQIAIDAGSSMSTRALAEIALARMSSTNLPDRS